MNTVTVKAVKIGVGIVGGLSLMALGKLVVNKFSGKSDSGVQPTEEVESESSQES